MATITKTLYDTDCVEWTAQRPSRCALTLADLLGSRPDLLHF